MNVILVLAVLVVLAGAGALAWYLGRIGRRQRARAATDTTGYSTSPDGYRDYSHGGPADGQRPEGRDWDGRTREQRRRYERAKNRGDFRDLDHCVDGWGSSSEDNSFAGMRPADYPKLR